MAELAHDHSYPFELNRLSKPAGAEICGLDLTKPLDKATRDELMLALLENHVLAIRDQDLTSEQQMAVTACFGTPETHVFHDAAGGKGPKVHMVNNLDRYGKPSRRPMTFGSFFWHTDKSYHEIPSLATFLHARELPPEGGDTEFANMYMAYDALDGEMKEEISDLRAFHSWEANRRNTGNEPATEEEKRVRPPVAHPIVRTHPDTERKTIYVGIHTDSIEGMDRQEGIDLLKQLYRHATQRQFVYTHQWKPGDLVIWDNRCLLHRVLGNYEMDKHRRILHRSVVIGTKPE